MDTKVMNSISYGLYVLTAQNCGFDNGCIINTLEQVTSSPNRVSIAVNKANFTEVMIRYSGRFNVSMLDETADFSIFTRFGFATGRWENKLIGLPYKRSENGIAYLTEHCAAYLSAEVVQTVDLGTHTLFIAEVTGGEVLSGLPSMTYAYYHANVKPKPAAPAETDDGEKKERWICNICGYIYEGHLPEDFVCPLCKHGAEDFSLLEGGETAGETEEKPSEAADGSADGGEKAETWVCTVCGYVHEGPLPEGFECPLCGVGAESFERKS
ncbi:MAG: flavin reductase [Ruminococcus sp.]|nr:flavin reductase [Ruminococcus sp.]